MDKYFRRLTGIKHDTFKLIVEIYELKPVKRY